MPNIKKIKKKAWKFYNKWREMKTYSPALQSEIRISLKGWKHISGATGAKKRTIYDTYRRLKLLPYAKQIIETSTTIQNVTIKGEKTFFVLEAMIKIEENGHEVLRKIRVILIEDKMKNKIFYSVMDKKQKKYATPHASV